MLDFVKCSCSGKFCFVIKFKKEKNNKNKEVYSSLVVLVYFWGIEEVVVWLEYFSFCEYKDIFMWYDIWGFEFLYLEWRDFKDLGVIKVGYMKRILCGIKELSCSVFVVEV